MRDLALMPMMFGMSVVAELPVFLLLILEVLAGVIAYAGLAAVFHLRGFDSALNFVKNKLNK